MLEDDLHAAVGIAFEHAQRLSKLRQRKDLGNEIRQLYAAAGHQVDRLREVLTRSRAGSHNRRFFAVELIKRQRSFAGSVDPEQNDRATRTDHRDGMRERLYVAR